MPLEISLDNLATTLDKEIFELTSPKETQQTYSWMTNEELLRYLSVDNTPLIIELRERLEKASEDLISSEVLATDLENSNEEYRGAMVNAYAELEMAIQAVSEVKGHFKKNDKQEILETLNAVKHHLNY